MEDTEVLPRRSEVGEKSFSPFIDRFSLVLLTITGIIFARDLALSFDPVLGNWSFPAVFCGLIFSIPLIASSIGKMYVRIRS